MQRESRGISSSVEVIAELKAGRMVVLVDDEDREDEGDLILGADHVSAEAVNFMARYARGLVCLAITEERRRLLGLQPMVSRNRSQNGTNFTVSIEAAEGVTTGISAHDRAHTIRVACSPNAKPSDIVQPGHVFPIVAQDGGVLVRAGHAEAGCDIARLAGLTPAAVTCEILSEDGTMARLPQLREFAASHQLKIGTIADLIEYRSTNESLVRRVAIRDVTTLAGKFSMVGFRDLTSGHTHLALTCGDISGDAEVLVRVHVVKSAIDLLDADAGKHPYSISQALERIKREGRGVVLLLHALPEPSALEAALSESDATLPAPMDLRFYGIGAQILRDLGVRRMRVMSFPRRIPSLAGFGLEITRYVGPEGDSDVGSGSKPRVD
jgi:3,4-dihydroxy 2-butanone 4-phosphate synthase/GTP cyclohydrolase II